MSARASSARSGPVNVRERCSECKIRNQAVCAYCGPSEIAQLDAIKFYRDFDPGQEIVAADEQTQFLGSVVEGVVSLSRKMHDGRRQTVGLMFPSDFIGRPMRPVAPYDAVALTPVRLCLFARSQFERILGRSPSLERRLLEMTLDELDAAHEWMLLLGRKTAREKVAKFLAILARRAAALEGKAIEGSLIFELPLTRAAMAEYLGLSIETVSRHITGFKRSGVIDLLDSRLIRVPNHAALLDVSGDDADGGPIT